MRVMVTGGRDFKDREFLEDVLSELNPQEVRVGDCPTGVDRFARDWVQARNVSYVTYTAYWDTDGRAAGPLRNARMVKDCSVLGDFICLAFPGGRGTEDCVRRAKAANMIVLRVEP